MEYRARARQREAEAKALKQLAEAERQKAQKAAEAEQKRRIELDAAHKYTSKLETAQARLRGEVSLAERRVAEAEGAGLAKEMQMQQQVAPLGGG